MRVAILFLASACGRIGFDGVAPDAIGVDDADAASMTDASFVRPGCTWTSFDILPASMTVYGSATVTDMGQLHVSTTGLSTNPGGVTTTPASMVGRSSTLQIAQVTVDPLGRTGIGWHQSPTTTGVTHFYVHQGLLTLTDDARMLDTSLPYDATSHRWLRLREDSGRIHAETSPDGIVWTAFGMTDIVDSSSIFIDVGIDAPDGDLAGPDEALFDNYLDCAP